MSEEIKKVEEVKPVAEEVVAPAKPVEVATPAPAPAPKKEIVPEPVKVNPVDLFAKPIVGKRSLRSQIFSDEKLGFVVEIIDMYPGDRLEIQRNSFTLKEGKTWTDVDESKKEGGDGSEFLEINIAKTEMTTIVKRVKRWNITDEQNKPVLINFEELRKIDKIIFDLIIKWIKEFDKVNEDSELGNSASG